MNDKKIGDRVYRYNKRTKRNFFGYVTGVHEQKSQLTDNILQLICVRIKSRKGLYYWNETAHYSNWKKIQRKK